MMMQEFSSERGILYTGANSTVLFERNQFFKYDKHEKMYMKNDCSYFAVLKKTKRLNC